MLAFDTTSPASSICFTPSGVFASSDIAFDASAFGSAVEAVVVASVPPFSSFNNKLAASLIFCIASTDPPLSG